MESSEHGSLVNWRDVENPGKKEFVFNYRVDNLEGLLKTLKEEGLQIVGKMETHLYGKFGWIMAPLFRCRVSGNLMVK